MIKPCWRFSLCFQDSSHCHVFIYYCASKPSKSLFLLLQPAFKNEKKKKKKIKGTDCEAFQREEIWQVILFKKCVIKSTHLPFTYSLFSDERGWKELQVRDQISRDESPGSSINTLLNLSEPLFWFFKTPKMGSMSLLEKAYDEN